VRGDQEPAQGQRVVALEHLCAAQGAGGMLVRVCVRHGCAGGDLCLCWCACVGASFEQGGVQEAGAGRVVWCGAAIDADHGAAQRRPRRALMDARGKGGRFLGPKLG